MATTPPCLPPCVQLSSTERMFAAALVAFATQRSSVNCRKERGRCGPLC
jgi:hypothetical protein